MEVAMMVSALVGTGIAFLQGKRAAPRLSDARAVVVPIEPEGHINSEAAHTIPTTAMRSGRRDNSLVIDDSSLEERHGRYYGNAVGSKRETVNAIDPSSRVPNVHVRSQTNYTQTYADTMDRPTRMHGVTPFPTKSGTAHELVGPGLGLGATEAVGTHGVHYGAMRIRPVDVHNHFREQKGSIVPGKSAVDKRGADVVLGDGVVSTRVFGEHGYVAGEGTAPLRSFEITEAYMTSAPGRASVTAPPGPGGVRVHTDGRASGRRGMDGVDPAGGAFGTPAAPVRGAQVFPVGPARQQVDRAHGPPTAPSVGAYGVSTYAFPATERSVTGHAIAERGFGPARGSDATADWIRSDAIALQHTQRGSATDAVAYTNVGTTGPAAHWRASTNVRATTVLPQEYRPGPAQTALPAGAVAAHASRSDVPTQRETLRTAGASRVGPAKAVGINAPMSYADMLASEGYSLRALPQSEYVAPAGGVVSIGPGTASALGDFDARPAMPNAERAGGAGGVANQNGPPVRSWTMDVKPAKTEHRNDRLDPRVLDALARNEFAIAVR